jgi:hypothetical protein
MANKIIRITITSCFILLFLYTGISKLWNYRDFISEIHQSPWFKILPGWLVWIIPAFEIATAYMLATRRFRLKGLYISCIMTGLFTLYILGLSQFTYYIPCSCGGLIDTLPNVVHIILNAALAILAMLAIYLEKGIKQTTAIRNKYLS